VIISGADPGSTRVFGTAEDNLAQGCILICENGANNSFENCSGDDELLGTGGTNASGQMQDFSGPGIGLSRPLEAGDVVCAYDMCVSLQHNCFAVIGPMPAPALSPHAFLIALMLLGLVGAVSLLQLRRRGR
jgi:hypothetical protein